MRKGSRAYRSSRESGARDLGPAGPPEGPGARDLGHTGPPGAPGARDLGTAEGGARGLRARTAGPPGGPGARDLRACRSSSSGQRAAQGGLLITCCFHQVLHYQLISF